MNYLIGDIGNTNIKFCKVNKNFKIIKTYFFQTKKLGLEKIYTVIGKTAPSYSLSNTTVSASSISEITGIPRATCIRKLEKLMKLGMLKKELKSKKYYVNQSTVGRGSLITKETINSTISNLFIFFDLL